MAITRTFAVVANRARTLTWQSLNDFCTGVIGAMTTNAVTFPAPPVPLVDFSSDNNDLNAALTAWGAVGNRGSHADYIILLAAAQQVLNDLDAEAGYVQTVARASFPGSYLDQVSTVLLAGMRAKDDSNRLAVWGAVNDFEQLVKPNLLNTGFVHLKWKKPNVSPGAMSRPPAYNVYVSDDNITFTTAGTTSSTSFNPNIGTGVRKYYKVAAVSSAGEGALSSAIVCYGQ